MAERYRHSRTAAKRQPLAEIPNQIQLSAPRSQQKDAKVMPLPQAKCLPHNESLEPNGTLSARKSPDQTPEHKRVSEIVSDESDDVRKDPKRNSAISTASTTASNKRRKQYIGQWQLGKTIGKGGCSRVRVVRHRFREQYGAAKIITRADAERSRAQSLLNLSESTSKASNGHKLGYKPIPLSLEREIVIMKLLEHENIVRLYDVWENRNELYLVMEYVQGGELFHYVDARKGLEEDETVCIFRQIVSALLYCHRLRICHRDLKPENILLEQEHLTVKLIDFGMAALQPEGQLLSTPCGSPHYAAPEVVSGRPYDGTQADVWSCGVILYVMLTGTTPYNYPPNNDIRVLFQDITEANYRMPKFLSMEAADLIKRIFTPDPKCRITMDEVWDHALLHKYDQLLGWVGEAGTKEAAIGKVPTLDDWKVKRIQEVDRDVLSSMRTLWHSESESSLVKKLLNDEYNQQKLFYAALIKHREEYLENEVGNSDGMDYSTSDYHHQRRLSNMQNSALPSAARSQSQYSIKNDEHLRPSLSFFDKTPSIHSYDPYRASKDPIVSTGSEYYNVTVNRKNSTRMSTHGRTLRHPNALRIEMLKRSQRRAGSGSASSLVPSGRSRISMPRSSISRSSLAGSAWASSPPVIASTRPSDRHKRGVSFGHLRRVSTATAFNSLGSRKGRVPSTPRLSKNPAHRSSAFFKVESPDDVDASSPAVLAAQGIRSRKERGKALATPKIRVTRPDSAGHQMRSDIRKHSAELEKFCDEAFFHSSMASATTAQSTATEGKTPYETPPSSVGTPNIGCDSVGSATTVRVGPALIEDTPNSYLTRTLEETRQKLAAYRAVGDDANVSKFDEVMRMLETVMPTTTRPYSAAGGARNFTAPDAMTPDYLRQHLPMITEESDGRSSKDSVSNWRSITSPSSSRKLLDDKTVRMVEPSSPATHLGPPTARKRSNASASRSRNTRLKMSTTDEDDSRKVNGVIYSQNSTAPLTPPVVRKKRSWFGLAKKDIEDTETTLVGPSPPGRTRHVWTPAEPQNDKIVPGDPPPSAISSEFPMRKKRFEGAKSGLARWWPGRKAANKPGAEAEEGDTTVKTGSLDSLFSARSRTPSSDAGPITTGHEQSWFSKFFHIKPLTKALCFTIPRGKARQELVILLREWQRHGVRDLQYSRQTNSITARVDKRNALDIKPISFRIELFVVLEHGKQAKLSIARFVQVKGAASGFRKVLEVVDGVMRGRGWLVEDAEKWRALSEIVGC